MKIAIAIPSMEMVHTDFALSLANIMYYTKEKRTDLDLAVMNAKSSIIQKGRFMLVSAALQINADKILFLDSDMIFPANLIQKLINWDKDIIGCNYATRKEPVRPTCKDKEWKYVDFTKAGCREVGYIGTGALMVSMEVFKKMQKPYFRVEWDDKKGHIGEDYCFCEDARKLGYEVFCDFDLSRELLHIGNVPYGL